MGAVAEDVEPDEQVFDVEETDYDYSCFRVKERSPGSATAVVLRYS